MAVKGPKVFYEQTDDELWFVSLQRTLPPQRGIAGITALKAAACACIFIPLFVILFVRSAASLIVLKTNISK